MIKARFAFTVAEQVVAIESDQIRLSELLKSTYLRFLINDAKPDFTISIFAIKNLKNVRPFIDKAKLLGKVSYPSGSEINKELISEISFNIKLVFARFALDKGMLLLHASSVVNENGCYIFCGESGAGKSTISNILNKSQFGIKTNDDSVLISSESGKVIAFNNPFSEKDKKLYKPGNKKVVGLFELKKSKEEEVSILGLKSAAKVILKNSYIFQNKLSDKKSLTKYFVTCYNYAQILLVYKLKFSKSPEFINKIKEIS